MRLRSSYILLLCLLYLSFVVANVVNAGADDVDEDDDDETDNIKEYDKQNEWNDLIDWFRKFKEKENVNELSRLTSDENYSNFKLNDEATDPRGEHGDDDVNIDWDNLIGSTTTGYPFTVDDEDLEEENRIRGASLAFVFDSTGSMRGELDQVKAGAKQILAALRDHPDAPIYNYIWVPFRDPAVGPVTVTTDPNLFQERIHDVQVYGGGDCPEMSITAIKKALEACLPNSYIYVFTDASAKDYRLEKEVLSLIQKKQAQVVFILTDTCQDLDQPNHQAYERIAETSSGQIYSLSKNEVKEVLKYVKVALQPHVVSLVSLKKPAPDKSNPDKLEVVIDDSLTLLTVSVSGVNASINVTDPKGVHIEGPPKLEKVLNLTNIKIVNVKEPDPGSWNVYIGSDSNYTVRSTGLSKINFNHGFSTIETTNLKETNYRPLQGARSYILIQTSDFEKIYNLTNVDFVSLSGDILQRLDLTPVPHIPGLYKGGGSFIPPPDFFYLGVTGYGEDGQSIKRITSTAISSQLPGKPVITMRPKTIGRINSGGGSLKCHVESVVPITIRWYKNSVFAGKEQNCSETCEASFNFDKFTLDSEGTYHCSAKNVAGFDSASTYLSIIGDAPSVTVDSPVEASPGQRISLDCFVHSKLPYTVSWSQFTATNQHSGVLHQVSTGVKLENNSLYIESIKPEDMGWYVCTAFNKYGESQGRVFLVVNEPLIVRVEPRIMNFTIGGSARLTCSASGKPEPKLEWLKDDQQIQNEGPSVFVEEINGNLNLVIDYLEKKHAGVYACNAYNLQESVSATSELIYTEKPRIKAKENNLMVKVGSEVTMKCTAEGYPAPTITWYKRENQIDDDPRFQITEDETLTILSASSSDAGEYSCVGRNDLGYDVDYIGLIVGTPPSFLQKPKDKKIQINHNGTVPCSVIGTPKPEVKWRRFDGRELNPRRMIHLSSGALKIIRMEYEDAGQYVCTAENVFGSIANKITIRVTGIEKPVPDKNIELTEVKAISGSELTIPCGIILGNPPAKVIWFKNGVEISENDNIIIKTTGELIIINATIDDRGSYECSAVNVVGNSSRPYEIIISESPKIIEKNLTDLKATVGGEIVIPCPVEGYPLPSVIWTRNGSPLSTSSTVFQDERGSLIIRNLNENNSGTYVCTAINAVGSTSKATTLHVQVPPTFSGEVQDPSLHVVEGHVVVLDCNVSGDPPPTIQWFKNDEPLNIENEHDKILRFVGNVDDTGIFKCIITNEAGSISKDFNVTILVPPKILGRRNEESVTAKAGMPINLLCNVYGIPPPIILWQRNGMYLTQNTSDVIVTGSGLLTIRNITKESAGAYTCEAENLGGITQRTLYLQVNYPPRILEGTNSSSTIKLKEGDEHTLTCRTEGNPRPIVLWRKNGLSIHGHHDDLIVYPDNTLVFLQVTKDTTGLYTCEAKNSEGSSFVEYNIEVLIPPSLTSDPYPQLVEVNEGNSMSLTCPTRDSVPPPNIQWMKDGMPLDLLLHERADETKMTLSSDRRILTIIETHPFDRGNYSCVATNLAGRTDAKFFVDVLMIPLFEEFNHVAHRTILTGGEVVLNCSVTGNPQPKVTWKKGNLSVTPSNTPGVQISMDKQYLIITNGKVHHTGTYICMATNKIDAKEREFYVTVLEPPRILGSPQQTVEVMNGDNITLPCEGTGVPPPTFSWFKDGPKNTLNNAKNYLTIFNAYCNDSGLYVCEVKNIAGTRTKSFEVNVLESPKIENQDLVDNVTGIQGGNITMKCKMTGHPKPEITWLHNGYILNKIKKRSIQYDQYSGEWDVSDDGYASLTLMNVQEQSRGTYTLLASNRAGVTEKKFYVDILVPPTLLHGYQEGEDLIVVHPFPILLKCPVHGLPNPKIFWFYGDTRSEYLKDNYNMLISGKELRIKKSFSNHTGIYFCQAENVGGRVSYYFNVSVIEPPRLEGNKNSILDYVANETISLHCNFADEEDLKYTWYHSYTPVKNTSDIYTKDNGKTLIILNAQIENSGVYSCIAKNLAGSNEVTYRIDISEPPELSDESSFEDRKVVELHHPFSLYCLFTGYPSPEITWYKNNELFEPDQYQNSVLSDNSYLFFAESKPEDAGSYKCVANNRAGSKELNYKIDITAYSEWSQWSPWSQCSVNCGLGEQIRRRICTVKNENLDPRVIIDESKCVGDDIFKSKCFKQCKKSESSESTLGEWSECSRTCGGGVRRRHKPCDQTMKHCDPNETEEEACNEKECPINGQWSEWSEWSECSDTCGGGVKQRVRKCNSPSPRNGGSECPGWGSQLKICNRNKCESEGGSGKWLPWSEWSPCSETCGKGQRKRYRKCKAFRRGSTCKGENLQIDKCFVRSCYGINLPSNANLHVKGNINGNPVDSKLNVNINSLDNKRQITANMNNLNRDNEFPYAPFILSPVSWNAAYENGSASNGYSLTGGNFFSQSDIHFATGEELKVNHKGDGVDDNGTLMVEIEVIGEVPIVEPHASVYIKPITQDFVQTGSKTLYASTQNDVTVEGKKLPYYWNSSIQYDGSAGTMPYLVERLSMNDISNPRNKNVTFTATIEKKFEDDRCPPGFMHDPRHMLCQEINECENGKILCKLDEICENTFGSYECTCRRGYKKTQGRCVDIDECSTPNKQCSHLCHNTPGSFLCSCPNGYYLAYDLKNCIGTLDNGKDVFQYEEPDYTENEPSQISYSLDHDTGYDRLREFKAAQTVSCPPGYVFNNNECKDYNECQDNPDICDKDETCINFPGSFFCLSIPCPVGYERDPVKKLCKKQCLPNNKCQRGATLSEFILFHPLTVKSSEKKILDFDKIDDFHCSVVKTKYRVVESNGIFEVKVFNGKGSLYTTRRLNRETLYRVKIEAFSYGLSDALLFFTEYVVFIVVV